jgi:hypothetical protein
MGSLTRGFLHFGAGLYTVEAELEAAAETEAEPTSDVSLEDWGQLALQRHFL